MTEPLRFTVRGTPRAAAVRAQSRRVTMRANPRTRVIVAAGPGRQGQTGMPGGVVERLTAAALSGHTVVTPDDNGTVNYADATNIDHANRPMWLTTGAWLAEVMATLVSEGEVTEPSWSWTPGLPLFLGTNGALTQAIPVGAVFVRTMAEVVDPQTIWFAPEQPIVIE